MVGKLAYAKPGPSTGELDGSDPQRRLALLEPILPCGDTPPGFMGYAVNMVDLDEHHVYTRTSASDGLRETLFYRLFGKLQVYRIRQDVIRGSWLYKALFYISRWRDFEREWTYLSWALESDNMFSSCWAGRYASIFRKYRKIEPN
ncbi:protein DEFECTIVE IN MERISTEM SILENCING 3-like [Pistacia vera]|uniref:protein DEFECTIVE IN MERISTEM SILENCING 3-like n=1 Tax=Pistacia vera TaxID=55513 RepID=UPI0012631C7D|nr:protein DEFECTIVE IN MERISTEM SILENCING 3-like [Pistacia vera]